MDDKRLRLEQDIHRFLYDQGRSIRCIEDGCDEPNVDGEYCEVHSAEFNEVLESLMNRTYEEDRIDDEAKSILNREKYGDE